MAATSPFASRLSNVLRLVAAGKHRLMRRRSSETRAPQARVISGTRRESRVPTRTDTGPSRKVFQLVTNRYRIPALHADLQAIASGAAQWLFKFSKYLGIL